MPGNNSDEVRILLGPSIISSEINGSHMMRKNLLDTIDRATEKLLIVGYMLNSTEIAERIIPKCSKMEVIVHLDEAQTFGDERATAVYNSLIQAGALVKLHSDTTDGSMHAKVIISDNTEAIVGSANLTYSGADRNLEIGVRIRGPSVKILRDTVTQALGVIHWQ
jgi:phosphatidylserine/phosphatidylglycerophosphate/cardiolipin synthase-like enzyme